jgi:hypothetical protein
MIWLSSSTESSIGEADHAIARSPYIPTGWRDNLERSVRIPLGSLMWSESSFGLPRYVTIASAGQAVLAFGHVDDFAGVLDWCARAMHQLEQADQIAVGSPRMTEWDALPSVSLVIPDMGWVRFGGRWKRAVRGELRRFFDKLPEGPRSLTSDRPQAPDAGTCHARLFDEGQVSATGLRERPPSEPTHPMDLASIIDAIRGSLHEERGRDQLSDSHRLSLKSRGFP